jgi:hypothetical protein
LGRKVQSSCSRRAYHIDHAFTELPDNTPESDIQFAFIGLVCSIASRLGLGLDPKSETKIIVAGIPQKWSTWSDGDFIFWKLRSDKYFSK